MAIAGVYRRVLPSPPAIEFASLQGKRLFSEALGEGNMEGFFKLISYYQTQSEPAYCGLATLAMVLNALSIDPGRKWKGPWRWFDDSMLDCCEPLVKIKAEGITFSKVACLARCNGAKVVAFRTNESSVDDFRKYVISSTTSEDFHVITSYHRGILKQTGSGHFSPIGGYHSASDMVLILDVARFKYPPHWVPLALLWDAMNTNDDATGQPRGYMIISRLARGPSILYTVSCRDEGWNDIAKYLTEDVPLLLKSENVKDISQILSAILISPPPNLTDFIKWVAEVRRHENESVVLSEEEKGRLAIKVDVLKQVRETELYKYVSKWVSHESSLCEDLTKTFCDKDNLPETAATICCPWSETLLKKAGSTDRICCKKTDLNILKANSEKLIAVAYDTEQGIDMLVPLCETEPDAPQSCQKCSCHGMSPSTIDVLTILLLSLPHHTWCGIKGEEALREINRLVSTDNLPTLLQEEVLYLREQLLSLTTDLGVSTSA